MPTFDVDPERITVFRVDDQYYFAHYFDREDVFDDLRAYYDEDAYRFVVPAEDFEEVRARLQESYYTPVVVEDLEPYCVLTDRYDEHAEILKRSVLNWERRGRRFFLMTDDLAVEDALERGATRLAETELALGL